MGFLLVDAVGPLGRDVWKGQGVPPMAKAWAFACQAFRRKEEERKTYLLVIFRSSIPILLHLCISTHTFLDHLVKVLRHLIVLSYLLKNYRYRRHTTPHDVADKLHCDFSPRRL
jgi:hypothetical protein